MTVKLALLKSGEQVISDVKELVDENQKVVSLVFSNPYAVQLLTPELLYEDVSTGLDEVNHRVSFSPWIPLSVDKTIPVAPDWIVSIVEPNEWIKSSYLKKMSNDVEGQVNEDLPISPSKVISE